MKTNKQILEAFKGQTFSSNEDVMLWLEQSLKDVEERVKEECLVEEAIAVTRAEERVKAEIVEKILDELAEPSYIGVLESNEQRRGYEKAFTESRNIIKLFK